MRVVSSNLVEIPVKLHLPVELFRHLKQILRTMEEINKPLDIVTSASNLVYCEKKFQFSVEIQE